MMSGVHSQRKVGTVRSFRSCRFGEVNPGIAACNEHRQHNLRVHNDAQFILASTWMIRRRAHPRDTLREGLRLRRRALRNASPASVSISSSLEVGTSARPDLTRSCARLKVVPISATSRCNKARRMSSSVVKGTTAASGSPCVVRTTLPLVASSNVRRISARASATAINFCGRPR